MDKENLTFNPSIYNYIELVAKDYGYGLDLIFAYDDPDNRGKGTLYVGRWNDGIVE